MSPLNLSFTIFEYCGIWRPLEWSSGWKFWLYNFYTTIVFFFIFTMPVGQLIDLIVAFESNENPVESIAVMLTFIAGWGSAITMIAYRQRIIKLLENLDSGICRAKNSDEEYVVQKFGQLIRWRTKAFGLWISMTIITMSSTYFTRIQKKIIPYKMWLPFDITTNTLYELAFADEYVSMFILGLIALAYSTLVPGIILQTCTQFELLKCRIQSISTMPIESTRHDESKCSDAEQARMSRDRITDCVKHHLLIYQLVNEANRIFDYAILLKYMTTTTVLCMNVYKMSQIDGCNVQQLVALFIYTFTCSLQMFMLCYAGSELNDESLGISRAIYDTEWYTLSKSNKKSLLIMMIRSFRPITFTTGKIFHVSNEVFVNVMQFSYSLYTVLKRMST